MAHAPASADLVSLTPHPRGWRKKIGKASNGQPQQFYFGSDEASAKVAALEKMREWDARVAKAKALGISEPTWATQLEAAEERAGKRMVERFYERGAEPKPTRPGFETFQQIIAADEAEGAKREAERAAFLNWQRAQQTPSDPASGTTIEQAKQLYLSALKRRVGLLGSLGIDSWTYNQTSHKLNRAMEFCEAEYMGQLTYQTIEQLVYKLASRPSKKPNPLASEEVQKAQRKEQVSQRTALGWISEVKAFLLWAADEEAIGWTLPKHVAKLWKIRPEAEEQQIRTVSQEEIAKLREGAINENAHKGDKGERRRLYLLLGLNCGFYGVDIATLKPEHIKVEGNDSYIWKLRRKTRKTNSKLARTKWKLWPETRELLNKYLPLEGVTANGVRLAWDRLVKVSGVEVSHSNLRDTGAVYMEKQGGRELADTYLAHSRKGPIDSYSHPDWDNLSDALDRFYSEVVQPALSSR
jgi:hypothetical protein